MYIPLLISKYLRRKLAPIFAALAVTLCTAMVIIVISVMGGFLDLMSTSARKLTADVIVRADLYGIPHYDAFIQKIESQPEVASATPVIQSVALVSIFDQVHPLQIFGITPEGYDAATGYGDALYWTTQAHLDEFDRSIASQDYDLTDPDVAASIANARDNVGNIDPMGWGMSLEIPQRWRADPKNPSLGAVIGIHVNPYSRRDEKGEYDIGNSAIGSVATVTVLPITKRGDLLDRKVEAFSVVNEFKSGLFEIDKSRMFVPFEILQAMLEMQPADKVDPETGEPTGEKIPGRASQILVSPAPGVNVIELKQAVNKAKNDFTRDFDNSPFMSVETWREQHGTFLGAVEKEKFLVTIMFAIISVVAFAMIAVIFYMIVLEKTRDIGTLRALGASKLGIASIFLGYGLAIGIVGATLGLILAATFVTNINEIQDFLTRAVGFTMWDPAIYYFDRIPGKLDPTETTVIIVIAILCSVLGSAIPAWLASRVDPVRSLRYE